VHKTDDYTAPVCLVGVSDMGVEYAKVLDAINVPFTAVGRGGDKAKRFLEKTGHKAVTGGLAENLASGMPVPASAIVAVGVDQLAMATLALLQAGTKSILVEKPGAMTAQEAREIAAVARQRGAKVFIGYNRRFFASARLARSMIAADGGATSFHFEFTEWSHVIEPLATSPAIKQRWLLANSSHVIDLAFFLAGAPTAINNFTAGKLSWHTPAVFAGAGETSAGALFTYQANWNAPGRWSLEVLTPHNRLIFRPLEKLQVQKPKSVQISEVPLEDDLDTKFKPGLYRQVDAFLSADYENLCTIDEQIRMIDLCQKMAGYQPRNEACRK
jgi:predicted dehydrogenase